MRSMHSCLVAVLALTPVQATAGSPQVRSEVEGFRIASVDALPAPREPQSFAEGNFCRNLQIQPKTEAGKHAARLGWRVTSEESLAGFDVIGIFSRGGEATSGTCLVADGNVVVYRSGQPIAIVYQPRRGGEAGGRIGGVVPTLSSDRLRISDFTPPRFESADIVLSASSIVVTRIASMETACGGVQVPNLRGKGIPEVRKALAPLGWKPAVFRDTTDGGFDAAADFRKAGLTEFETCSGTGYGFCSVRYTHGDGPVLDITTTGDEPEVSGYHVQCNR